MLSIENLLSSALGPNGACGGSYHSLADVYVVAGMRARASQKGKLERTEGQALLLTQQRKEVTEEEDLKTADGKVVHKVSHESCVSGLHLVGIRGVPASVSALHRGTHFLNKWRTFLPATGLNISRGDHHTGDRRGVFHGCHGRR